MTVKLNKTAIWEMCKNNLLMLAGILIYVISYVYFLLPYQLISGGMNGIATLIYYTLGFHPSITYLVMNIFLIIIGAKIMGWNYCVKTVLAIGIISFLINLFQQGITTVDAQGNEQLMHIVGDQKFMACVIGALMEGLGLALVFLSGGSTGGIDIIASSINKYWNISMGRLMFCIDLAIIGSSYFIFHNLETMVVGYLTMLMSMFFLDYVTNGLRQSVQFIIVSDKYEEIATEVNQKMERGVTVLYGEGFYSKEKRQVLLILAKKFESRALFALIRQIDPRAFVSMGNVEGVFGEGFDKIKR
ncbi:MAG: YitT family protein [Bacteroidaceae bacterium]|nr:YitT family protein [Bacteroidaceae bacterium]